MTFIKDLSTYFGPQYGNLNLKKRLACGTIKECIIDGVDHSTWWSGNWATVFFLFLTFFPLFRYPAYLRGAETPDLERGKETSGEVRTFDEESRHEVN